MARHVSTGKARTGSEFASLDTLDGPTVDVGRSDLAATIRFGWGGPNQRWYLTPDEARKIAEALAAAADAVELDNI